jgi:splicing factor 3B subunit 1
MATPTPNFTPFYAMPEDNPSLKMDMPVAPEGLPEMKPDDMQYFGKLLQVSGKLLWVREKSCRILK